MNPMKPFGLEPISWFFIGLAVAAAVFFCIFALVKRWLDRRRKQKRLMERGRKGEQQLYDDLSQLKGDRKILQNLYIPTAHSTTEIDLVMLHHSGIYVFENKAYSGWIFGSAESQYWTQTLPNGYRFSFYNPVRQNEGHVAALMKYLGITNRKRVHSIIVFSDACTFKDVNCQGKFLVNDHEVWLVQLKDLDRALKKTSAKFKYTFTRKEISEIYDKLLPRTKVSFRVKQQHIKNVKKKQKH